jgi:hypothetical protein
MLVLENKQSGRRLFVSMSVCTYASTSPRTTVLNSLQIVMVHLPGHGAFITHKTSFHTGAQTRFNISYPVTDFRNTRYSTLLILYLIFRASQVYNI